MEKAFGCFSRGFCYLFYIAADGFCADGADYQTAGMGQIKADPLDRRLMAGADSYLVRLYSIARQDFPKEKPCC